VFVAYLLLSPWASILVSLDSIAMIIQMLGVIYLLNLKLSAITAMVLIPSIGFNVCFTAHSTLVSTCQNFPFPNCHF
jgi:hypothetical protein